ncbi:MAG TPA: NAD-dependent epimerase/dehydratase family protein [Gemmatimonadaceae bacterium]
MTRALVTGATGLVGSHIVERLLADGWDVRGLVRAPASPDVLDLQAIGLEPVQGDVLDRESFVRAAKGVDVIFHTVAAITQSGTWETYRRLNVGGTENAIAAAEAWSAKLLQLSSVAVYGPDGRFRDDGRKTDEDTPLTALPDNAHYARSKRESEQLVIAAHRSGRIWATAVRPDVIYGSRDRQFVPRMARIIRSGVAPIIGNGQSTLPIVHAANVADGAVRAAMHTNAGGHVYNLANDFDLTAQRFFELGAHGLGRRVRFVRFPLGLARVVFGAFKKIANTVTGGGFNAVSNASISFISEDNPFTSDRARREIGWSPRVDHEHGVPEAFHWWLTNQR